MHVLGISVGVGTAVRAPEGERDAPSSPGKPPPRRSLCNREEGSPSPPEEGRGWDQQAREHGGTVIREAWP